MTLTQPARVPILAAITLATFAGASFAQQQRIVVNNNGQPVVIIRGDAVPMGLQPDRFAYTPDPQAAARLDEAIVSLSATDAQVREETSRRLEDDRGISLSMIDAAIRAGGDKLPLEARIRLVAAARDRFWRTPRAALGIQFWNNLRDRVVVEQTFKEFDSAAKLEDGDMIVEADGRKIEGYMARNRLQAVIVSHDPGETIKLVVRRAEQKLNIDVKLGRRDDLANSTLTDDIMARAWQVRSSAMMPDTGKPISTGIKPGEWQVTPIGQNRISNMALRAKGVDSVGVGAVGGGMPRGADLSIDAISMRLSQGQIRNNRAAQQILWQQAGWNNGMMGWDPNAESAIPPMTRRQELDEMLKAQVKISKELESWAPADPDLTPTDRKLVQGGRDERVKMLSLMQKQIKALRAEMTENNEPLPDDSTATTGADNDQPDPKR